MRLADPAFNARKEAYRLGYATYQVIIYLDVHMNATCRFPTCLGGIRWKTTEKAVHDFRERKRSCYIVQRL